MVRWLASDGYDPVAVGEFKDARRELDAHSPDLLVSDVKLDAYNGLHLAIWGRGKGLATRSILIGEPDLVLQKEAERERAAYLTPPLEQKAFLTTVASLLSSYTPARRSPRKRVVLEATVDGVLASLVDLSYEGLRLEVRNAEAITLPSFFTLQVPTYERGVSRPAGLDGPTVNRAGCSVLRGGAPGHGRGRGGDGDLAQLRRYRSRGKRRWRHSVS